MDSTINNYRYLEVQKYTKEKVFQKIQDLLFDRFNYENIPAGLVKTDDNVNTPYLEFAIDNGVKRFPRCNLRTRNYFEFTYIFILNLSAERICYLEGIYKMHLRKNISHIATFNATFVADLFRDEPELVAYLWRKEEEDPESKVAIDEILESLINNTEPCIE